MVCIYCRSKTQVANSRSQKRANQTWRRRACLSCEAIFTTVETTDLAKTVVVAKASGEFRALQRDKLFLSIYDTLRHRKTALEDATALTDTVLAKALPCLQQGSLARTDLQRITHETLASFDTVAAVQYQAFHP